MNKMTLLTAVDKYHGWILEFQPGKYLSQNSNDLCLCFGYRDDLEATIVKVQKIIKHHTQNKEYKIVLCSYGEYFEPDKYSERYDTLDDAIQSIVECWE